MLYHVIARGNNKERIYRDTRDFDSFLELLGKGLERFSVQCLAYCLMHTHYHLVLKAGPHPVSRLMQQALDAGAQAFGGLGMLVRQGALSFEQWTGVTPPLDVMENAARQSLITAQ